MRQGVRDLRTGFDEPLEARLDVMYPDVKGLVRTGLDPDVLVRPSSA